MSKRGRDPVASAMVGTILGASGAYVSGRSQQDFFTLNGNCG